MTFVEAKSASLGLGTTYQLLTCTKFIGQLSTFELRVWHLLLKTDSSECP